MAYKKETIHKALEELVRYRLRQELIALEGREIRNLSLDELAELRQRQMKKHSEHQTRYVKA